MLAINQKRGVIGTQPYLMKEKSAMAHLNDLLLLSSEQTTVDSVSAALAKDNSFKLAGVCATLADLVDRLAAAEASVVLADVDPDPLRFLHDLEPITTQYSKTRFVILSKAFRNDLIFEAMQIGARHYLSKDSASIELPSVLRRFVRNGFHEPTPRGMAIMVLGASGGCGATTLACNLANELGLRGPEEALLVDLDSSYGAITSYLGLEGQYGVADILAHDSDMDAHLLRSTTVRYSDALHVLLSPAGMNFANAGALRFDALSKMISVCKQTYSHTVVDAPRVPMKIAAELADSSDVTLIVFQLTVKDIQMARLISSTLISHGIPPTQIVPVVNRYEKRNPVELEEAQKAMGEIHLELVRNDFKNAVDSINYGQLLARVAPTSALRRDIGHLAAGIRLRRAIVRPKVEK